MSYRDEDTDLELRIHAENYEVSLQDRERIEADLETLRRLVKDFPVAQLHVHIDRNTHNREFHVKTNLRLPKRSLFTGSRHDALQVACEACVRKLIHKVKRLKDGMSGRNVYRKQAEGKHDRLGPEETPDSTSLEEAARDGDFVRFREGLGTYEESLARRVTGHLARYPDLGNEPGHEIMVSECVDEVLLNAFEGFLTRPADRLGNWLEHLIDPSIRALLEHPSDERRNLERLESLDASGPPQPPRADP